MYKWELEALLLGIQLGQIDERERLAVLAANIGYFNNSKKPKFKKIFNRKREESELRKSYMSDQEKSETRTRARLVEQIRQAFG